jgi:hypothetical protein
VGTSTAQTVVLTNNQATALTITSSNLAGLNRADFTFVSACVSPLAPGANCSITVTFKPVGVNARTASLVIQNNIGTQTVALSGVSTQVKFTPTSLAFGGVTVGQQKALAVKLMNVGTSVLSIISPGVTITGTAAGDYSQTNTCGTSVAAGGSCTITVTFKPLKVGARAATVNVNDNGGLSPQKIPLNGTGL